MPVVPEAPLPMDVVDLPVPIPMEPMLPVVELDADPFAFMDPLVSLALLMPPLFWQAAKAAHMAAAVMIVVMRNWFFLFLLTTMSGGNVTPLLRLPAHTEP